MSAPRFASDSERSAACLVEVDAGAHERHVALKAAMHAFIQAGNSVKEVPMGATGYSEEKLSMAENRRQFRKAHDRFFEGTHVKRNSSGKFSG